MHPLPPHYSDPEEDLVLSVILPEDARYSTVYDVPDLGTAVYHTPVPSAPVYTVPSLYNTPPVYTVPSLYNTPPVYTVPSLYSTPARNAPGVGPQPPVDPMTKVGQAQFSDLNVRERAKILSNLGATNQPDPRTLQLRSLADPAHAGEEAHGVKYIHDMSRLRSKYEVSVGSTMRRRLELFDTVKIKSFYLHKLGKQVGSAALTDEERKLPFKAKQRAPIGMANLGRNPDENVKWKELTKEWAFQSLIWVCSLDPRHTRPSFYSHIGKISKFHHSSFKAGGDVIGAGEWIVQKGKLLKISANSGHYRPTIQQFYSSVLYLSEAWNQNTVVLLWNTETDGWEEVPVQMFKDNPSRNGRYKVHALSS